MKLLFTSIFFSLYFFAGAQQNHFIYLQTENKQPFFVKLNNQVFSSSESGYLIIAKLQDGLYSLIIGFSKSSEEQVFNCSIKNKDVGFIIKTQAETGLQLVNVQTQNIIVPGEILTKKAVDTTAKETDPFSTMLANAVHDSSILQKQVTQNIIPEKSPLNDSSKIVAINTDTATNKPAINLITDSLAQKNLSNESISQTPTAKDTIHAFALNDSTSLQPVVNNLHTDSLTQTVAKDVNAAPLQKDSLQTATTDNPLAKTTPKQKIKKKIKKADSQDAAIVPIPTNSDVLAAPKLDTATSIIADNTVSAKKVKKKTKSVKPQDSTLIKNEEAVAEEAKLKAENKIDSAKNLIAAIDADKPAAEQKIKKKNRNNKEQDSSLITKDVVKETDAAVAKNNKTETPPFINFDNTAVIPRSIIKRKNKRNTKEGLEMMYVDDMGDTKDTIRILMPVERKKIQKDEADKNTDPSSQVVTAPKKEKEKSNLPEVVKEEKKQPVFINSPMINSDCKNFATDEDFLKIRKKMVAENNDEDMIKVAKKYFKTKCFTTEQIKNLSVLFLKDEGKYMFFDAAYPFASDSENYASLQSQLTDPYYITRFRAMIHK